MQARLFHLHALSALHCGVGQSEGVVDLPIARARASQLPIVPGSSLRGVLRQHVTDSDEDIAKTLFGPRRIGSDADSFAGALAINDAHLLALPVRCLGGIVSYVTSPFILGRYARDLRRAGATSPPLPTEPAQDTARVTSKSANLVEQTLVLEDLDLSATHAAEVDVWAEHIGRTVHPGDDEAQQDFASRLSLVPDDIMCFLAETATEVRARIRVDPETGTVSSGALWYEEHLPAETTLWGVFAVSRSNRMADERTADELTRAVPEQALLQVGGNAGVGHGLVRFLTSGVRA